MYNKCDIQKTCSVCQLVKNSLSFHSNRKGRTELKPYCKACKTIYAAIKTNQIDANLYIGKNFDIDVLDKDATTIACHQKGAKPVSVSVEKAIEMVKQGGASILSNNAIQCIYGWGLETSRIDILLREIIFKRDQGICYYCGNHADTLDHLIPRIEGGLNTAMNLVCCCSVCNGLKADLSVNEFLKKRREGEISDQLYLAMKAKLGVQPQKYDAVAFAKKVRCYTKLRKCEMCEEEKYVTKYNKHATTCRKCEKFIEPFNRGWIDAEKLSSITTDSKILKGGRIKLVDTNLDESIVKTLVAKLYLKCGVAEVVDHQTIRMLFTKEQVDLLYPDLVVNALKNRIEELLQRKKEGHTYPFTKVAERKLKSAQYALLMIEQEEEIKKQTLSVTSLIVSVFLEGTGCIGTLSREDARELILQEKAKPIKYNRIKISIEAAKLVVKRLNHVMPYNDMDSELKILLCERDAKLLVNSTIPVFSKGNKLIGRLPLQDARKLVLCGDAVRNSKGSVTLLKKKPLELMKEA